LDFALRWAGAETIDDFALPSLLAALSDEEIDAEEMVRYDCGAAQSLSTTMEPGCTAIDDVLLKRCHSESSDTASKTISK
jgi:hypothetical protein